jgi:hypothetical protein
LKKEIVIIICIACLGVLGCQNFDRPYVNAWRSSEVDNMKIELIDPCRSEWMHFRTWGHVRVNVGTRGAGGIGTDRAWEINSTGDLIVYGKVGVSTNKSFIVIGEPINPTFVIKKISVSEEELLAEVNGQRCVYRIIPDGENPAPGVKIIKIKERCQSLNNDVLGYEKGAGPRN